MNTKLITTRPATTAIAAVLALSATPVLAQQAPVIVLPDVPAAQAPAAAPATAPVTPAAPQAATTEMVSEPMVQAVPTPATTAEQPAPDVATEAGAQTAARAAPVATAPQAAPRAAAPAPAPLQTVAAAPENGAAMDGEVASPLAQGALGEGLADSADNAEIASVAPAAAPVDAATVESGDNSTGALLAGGAVIGLGLLGFAAFRRRKPGTGAPPVVEKPMVVQKDPLPTAATVSASTIPVTTIPATGNFDRAAPVSTGEPTMLRPQPLGKPLAAATAIGAAGGAVPLPRSMPESFEERDALLRRMVAAKPDRANPFHAPQARVRRARLIMQSLGQDFADRDPQFDTRDYPNNWPLVARRNYATAA